jgi:hypothetical protein
MACFAACVLVAPMAHADIISASCYRDIPAQTWPYPVAAERRSLRLDIDTTKLTATTDSATTPGDSDTFVNGRSSRETGEAINPDYWQDRTDFVVVSDRYIWFGYDAKDSTGTSETFKYRLDLQAGFLTVADIGVNYQCEKAAQNVFK